MSNLPAPSPSSQNASVYDWLPVDRVPRHNGWSISLQRLFIGTLADTGSVAMAARACGKTRQSAYALRRAADAGAFAAAWDAAIEEGARQLADVALDRALNGVTVRHCNARGETIRSETRHSDQLLMFLLRAHHPRYGAQAAAAEAAPQAAAPVAEAMAALGPPTPAEPRRLMSPEAFQTLCDDPVRFDCFLQDSDAHAALAEGRTLRPRPPVAMPEPEEASLAQASLAEGVAGSDRATISTIS